ncbi:MAG TPA: prepilin-type N-terminal cleavage/methylation domain-containing protein [Ilumatobacteraceae bacterium]|jgi:general secretion pathway protein G
MENHIEAVETKQDKGFTLVELLIVIVILGILATVTVFAVTGITNKGKTSACQSDAKTLQTAEESYSANNGVYTASQQSLVDSGLLHLASSKFTVNVYVKGTAVPANAGPDGIAGNADDKAAIAAPPGTPIDTYTVSGVAGGDCAGMTF